MTVTFLTPEQIQKMLADTRTLASSVEALRREIDRPWEEWDEVERLAFAGVVVRHAELGVPIPDEWRERAVAWLLEETIEWDEATARNLRRQKEINLLNR